MERPNSTLELAGQDEAAQAPELVEHDETAGAPELVKYDETTRAPEYDCDATAFELDSSVLAPQAMLYNDSFPEAHGYEESTKEHALSLHITKPTLKWPWMVMALVIAAAIAIGVSVETWRHREHSSHQSSKILSPPAPQNPNPPAPQSPNITRAAQYILNDTSLEAVSLPNGDRQLFFQDNTGLIRHAIRTESNGQWNTSSYLNINSNPKNNSSLAALISSQYPTDMGPQITLYYVSESHVLNASAYLEGIWVPFAETWTLNASDSYSYPGFIMDDYTTAVDTRSLSVTSVASAPSNTTSILYSALLYYENPNGKVSVLLLTHQNALTGPLWSNQCINITSQESKSLPDEFRNIPGNGLSKTLYESQTLATFSTPFTSGGNFSGSSQGALFYSPSGSRSISGIDSSVHDDLIMSSVYMVGPSGPGVFNSNEEGSSTLSGSHSSIRQSDIAMFGPNFAVWINGTQPSLISDLNATLPDNDFPFTRLASVISVDQSMTFLYHQMNGTTFAEEQWDASENAWVGTEYITISDS